MSEQSQWYLSRHGPEYQEDEIKILNSEQKLLQLRKMKPIIGIVTRKLSPQESLQKVEYESSIGKGNKADTSTDLDTEWTEKRLRALEKSKAYLEKARELNMWMNESNMRQEQSSSKSARSDPSELLHHRRFQVSS